ncbi:MAG: hypothetical protein ACHQ3P_02520 [Candidatus Limnocylindrales bacterium]
MTAGASDATRLDPITARPLLASLGFVANSDLPNRPGPAYLLVAIRPDPTLSHYDPERIDYWVTVGIHGSRRELTRATKLPVETEFSWGLIRIVDRLDVSNEYLSFGGRVAAAEIDDAVIGVFTSAAPILRRGGHSQGWDHGVACVGAFFARVLLAIDFAPGFEEHFSAAGPVARYAAFVFDLVGRYRRSTVLRAEDGELWNLLEAEERRLRADHPVEWEQGIGLSHEISPEELPAAS